MEKAIEIKRRAQRCIQNGDLDGALNEYEKLVGSEDSDPYNYVLLADLLYKKGDQPGASERYLSAVAAYEKASLYKNAIAVCKKMLRLSLSPAKVLHSLGNLHALDGLAGEAALYYVQYAEHMVRSSAPGEAATALRQAFDVCQDNIRVLEQLSEAWLLAGENGKAAQVLVEAATYYRERGADLEARRVLARAATLDPSSAAADAGAPAGDSDAAAAEAAAATDAAETPVPAAPAEVHPDPGALDLPHPESSEPVLHAPAPVAPPPAQDRMHGFETGRHEVSAPASIRAAAAPADVAPADHATADAVAADAVAAGAPPVDAAPAVPEPAEVPEAVEVYEEPPAVLESPVPAPVDAEPEPEPAPVPQVGAAGVPDDDVVVILDEPDAEMDESAEAFTVDPHEFAHAAAAPPAADDESADKVYEIDEAELIPFETAAAAGAGPAAVVHANAEAESTDGAPGLGSNSRHEPSPLAASAEERSLHEVERLLARAQEEFRSGDRDEASHTLMQAAIAYEAVQRDDSAATIYRSLGRGAHATPEMLEHWLANCERRGDAHEGAQVACDLGDRALNDGDEAAASEWFRRALVLDPTNETAQRRLQRLTPQVRHEDAAPAIAVAAAHPAPEAQPADSVPSPAVAGAADPAAPETRVEVAVGRAEAVSFDLAGLLAEFQRGVEAQLAGDAQSHYDLAMTYREMGLLDQAIESFGAAGQDPGFAGRAAEMVARCLADLGRNREAVAEFERALSMPMPGADDSELRYHYGNALSETGNYDEALAEYERVRSSLPGFADVEERVAALRRTLGRAA